MSEKITREWIEQTVIGLNLCPFAKEPFEKGQLRIQSFPASNFEELMTSFNQELQILDQAEPSEISNSFLVFPTITMDFPTFFDNAQTLEEIHGLNQEKNPFKLVVFHPQFVFAQADKSDQANLVNASPFPSLHLLRRQELNEAIKNSHSGLNIALQNASRIRSLTPEQVKKYWWFLNK